MAEQTARCDLASGNTSVISSDGAGEREAKTPDLSGPRCYRHNQLIKKDRDSAESKEMPKYSVVLATQIPPHRATNTSNHAQINL